MTLVVINVMLALAWAAVTGNFSLLNLAFGFALGALALLFIRQETGSMERVRRALREDPRRRRGAGLLTALRGAFGAVILALSFVYELIKSSVTVAIIVLSPGRNLRPAIIAYPLDATSDAEITMLANMITLTPGTLSMDVSDDRRTLYIHAIDAPDVDEIVNDIKSSFERRIIKVFNP